MHRHVGWLAIAAALFAVVTIVTSCAALGVDTDGLLVPATALQLSAPNQDLVYASMVADALGYYFLPAVVGAYFWGTLRTEHGPSADIATMCLIIYASLGLVGASINASTLPALSAAHSKATGEEALALEASWLGVAYATQRGVWLFEMLPLSVWCLIAGSLLRTAAAANGRILQVVGACWGALFIFGLCRAEGPALVAEALGLVLTPVWLFLLGRQMLKANDASLASTP